MDVGGICASPLWNQSISWDAKDPYFSECFKHLILVIGSCAVLWLVAPFEFVKLGRYQGVPLPWTTLSISKIVCKVLLLIICVLELIKEVYAYVAHIKLGLDGLFAAVAYFVTIILTVILTLMCRKRGLRSSIALPSFWMISTLTTVISVYDDIQDFDVNNWVSLVSLVDDSLTFLISLVQLILSNITEKGTTSTYGRQLMDHCPLDECSFISRLTFSWLLRLLVDSTKRSLHHDDLISLCSEFKSTHVAKRFYEVWSKNYRENSNSSGGMSPHHSENDRPHFEVGERRTINSPRKRSLFSALLKTSSYYITLSSIFEILYAALYFIPIYILSLILREKEEPQWHKYLFSVTLFVVLFLCTLIDSQRKYYGLASAFRIKTAVMNAIFEKALVSQRLENVEKHLQEDAESIFQMASLLSEVWGTPLRILTGLYLLWSFLGSASFVGVGTAALFIPLTILTSNTASIFHTKALDVKFEWLNVLSECLHGMRSLKLYVWEEYFLRKLKSLRKLEISKMRITLFLRILHKIIILSSTSLVSLVTFFVFVIMGNTFDLTEVFLSFATIYLLKSPFANILRLLAHFIQGLASVSRVQAFLESKEVHNLPESNRECGIRFENATFVWNDGEPYQLRDLTFQIDEGSLVAIIGEPLSGKSSLIRALMGEMEKLNGTADVKGEVAFVSDNTWIQNATLEENILFSRLKVDSIYQNMLRACGLLDEIENLPEGEETEIGEKGYPLTTCQKLKVDLARAVYQNADIYLLDEPFSFIDSSSAQQLFQKVIGNEGILQNKIRIFTTSDIEFLPYVDYIICLKDGKIVEQGNHSDLVMKNAYFREFVEIRMKPSYAKRKEERLIKPKNEFCFSFEKFKYQRDPWSSATGLCLKAEPENFMQGEITTAPRALIRKIVNYIKINGYIFILPSLLMATIANCCEVAGVTWFTWRTADFEKKNKVYEDLYIYAGFVIAQVLFYIICGLIISWGNIAALRKMYNWLLNRIMRASLTTFGTASAKRILESFDKDLRLSDEEIPVEFFEWLVVLIRAPVILMIIFVSSPILLLFFLPLATAFFIIQKLYLNAWRQLHHLSTSTRCLLFNLLQNVFQGISNIRASNAIISFISRFHTKQDNYNKCNFLFLLTSRWLSSCIEIIGCFFVLCTTLVVVTEDGKGSYLTGLLIVLAMQIHDAIITFTYLNSVLDIDLSCLERFQSFSSLKQEGEWENQLPHPWPTSGSITIQNMSTVYGEDLYPVLNNINISVRPGEKIAVIGKEDSGISTIFDSLFRIREIAESQIFIDNVDISNLGLHDLRSKIAVLPQDPLVFKGTVKENLDPEQKCTDEELQLIFKAVGLRASFRGLHSLVDSNLNPDAKYKIALARGKLKMSKILVVNGWANSTLENKHFEDCTLVLFGNSCVADNYDRIIRISSGEIINEEI